MKGKPLIYKVGSQPFDPKSNANRWRFRCPCRKTIRAFPSWQYAMGYAEWHLKTNIH